MRVPLRGSAALLALAGSLIASSVVAGPASAATPAAVGRISHAVENTFTHTLRVSGWAYDPAQTAASITVSVFADGTYLGRTSADIASPYLNAARHITGRHRFVFTVSGQPRLSTVGVRSRGAVASAAPVTLDSSAVTHFYPSPGERIITVAKKLVGARYADGGSGPTAFDCSGYTRYVYLHANVKTLVHNAEAQRRSMRPLLCSNARPGDLVFYMSGGAAYHVAVYAGHGYQYAAATYRDGVRFQKVWSSAVQYRTDWH